MYSKRKYTMPNQENTIVHKQITINEQHVIQQLRRKKTQKYEELKYGKRNTKNNNDNVYITQTHINDNQQRKNKEYKPILS